MAEASVAQKPGEGNVFDRLARRHQKQAYSAAYRMTGNHADAEDLTQEAFVRAFRFFGSYRRELPFDKWLLRIMSNLFVDSVRKSARLRTTSIDAPIGKDPESSQTLEIPDVTHSPERAALSSELGDQIRQALETLPFDFRKTVILADIEQHSYDEIAQIMNCTVGTVRSRLHRGRKMLRSKLTLD
jgi:RNA polymerase sigma-70 factor, ECF subfamily